MSGKYFLATTALEDFWDTSKPMVFLGEWCKRYQRRNVWAPLEAETCAPLWGDSARAGQAYQEAMAIYERLLPLVSAELNRFHRVNHDTRYWRIVVGPWLMHYVHVLYDRSARLAALFATGREFETIGLAEECFVTPQDTMDFVLRSGTDLYNLQLFTRLLHDQGQEFPTRSAQPELTIDLGKPRTTFKTWLLALAAGNSRFKGEIVLYNAYFSTVNSLKIAIKTLLRVQSINRNYQADLCAVDPERRKALAPLGRGDTFADLVLRFLPNDLPVCFVEGFKAIEERVRLESQRRPRAIIAANPWYYDEPFKHWAASCSEQGTYLYGIQHGGNYGSTLHLYGVDHETAIVDRYFTWGWSGDSDRFIPFFAPKLTGHKDAAPGAREGILLATTSMPRYVNVFSFVPDMFPCYLEWQSRFYASLRHKEALRIRPHFAELGWDISERLRENCPDVRLETWHVNFGESLRNCRLYVCDHLSTTFIEALVTNKPTVLFWDSDANPLTPEARPFYEALRNVGILHDSPEAAADTVDRVYDDVETWWNEGERQAAVKSFCNCFARTAPDALEQWVLKLLTLLTEGTRTNGDA